MPLILMEKVGRNATAKVQATFAGLGDFFLFVARVVVNLGAVVERRFIKLLLPLAYEVGVKSVPVVALTGAFIGMVLAIETYQQFRTIGQENRLGSIINVSVVKQIGPVLAAVMLAGRVGGALTAELGTMNVTEQLDALRVMGTDPVRHLVVPRVLACMLLTPILTIYSDLLGVLGGWIISTQYLSVPNQPYWEFSAAGVDNWSLFEGVIKSIFFGGSIGLIACFKGFTCGSGASGVGRACTESFVMSFIAIIVLNLLFADASQKWYQILFGTRSLFG